MKKECFWKVGSRRCKSLQILKKYISIQINLHNDKK